jgi:hypothetical protein
MPRLKGEIIEGFRQRLGLSQAAFAAWVSDKGQSSDGIEAQVIADVEGGKNVSPRIWRILSAAIGLGPGELLRDVSSLLFPAAPGKPSPCGSPCTRASFYRLGRQLEGTVWTVCLARFHALEPLLEALRGQHTDPVGLLESPPEAPSLTPQALAALCAALHLRPTEPLDYALLCVAVRLTALWREVGELSQHLCLPVGWAGACADFRSRSLAALETDLRALPWREPLPAWFLYTSTRQYDLTEVYPQLSSLIDNSYGASAALAFACGIRVAQALGTHQSAACWASFVEEPQERLDVQLGIARVVAETLAEQYGSLEPTALREWVAALAHTPSSDTAALEQLLTRLAEIDTQIEADLTLQACP